jgi:putative transposase
MYRRHRFPPDVIACAVRLYFRIPLSLRMVEDMLAERGIIVSHQTIRMWAEKFGRQYARNIRHRSAGQFDGKWHLDKVAITMHGVKHWLCRGID